MSSELKYCPKCNGVEFWQIKDGRLKCKKCRYLFTPRENIFNISNETLRVIISEFVLENPMKVILEKTKISKYKLLKVLEGIRKKLTKDIPTVFNGILSLKKEPENIKENLIIGVLSKNDQIFAKILNIEPQEVEEFLKNKEKIDKSEKWLENFAIIYKNSFYPLFSQAESQISTLKVFWEYLKKKLFTKRGVRKERFHLYLGEYMWRFNNQKLSLKEKEEKIWQIVMKK
jgi:transposase-like protein/ribosomal protein S27AE